MGKLSQVSSSTASSGTRALLWAWFHVFRPACPVPKWCLVAAFSLFVSLPVYCQDSDVSLAPDSNLFWSSVLESINFQKIAFLRTIESPLFSGTPTADVFEGLLPATDEARTVVLHRSQDENVQSLQVYLDRVPEGDVPFDELMGVSFLAKLDSSLAFDVVRSDPQMLNDLMVLRALWTMSQMSWERTNAIFMSIRIKRGL